MNRRLRIALRTVGAKERRESRDAARELSNALAYTRPRLTYDRATRSIRTVKLTRAQARKAFPKSKPGDTITIRRPVPYKPAP